MNLLKNKHVYLAGPIEDSKDDGVGWREVITKDLEVFGCHALNPMHKSKYFQRPFMKDLPLQEDIVGHISALKEKREFDRYSKAVSQIRHEDLRLVDKADFLIVRYYSTVTWCGTAEELFLANRQKKPILFWHSCSKENVPGWLFGTFPHQHMFGSRADVVNYLRKIDSGQFTEHDEGRWIL